jgi:hypothetical protein
MRIASSNFGVMEDKAYKVHFGRTDDRLPMQLYRVVNTFTKEEMFVIAESEKTAISQGTNKFHGEEYWTATQVPFKLRGWGDSKF